jgi:hypothetical protein
VLARRMKTRDAAGAEAAWARVESGELDLGSVRRFAAAIDTNDSFRAVGTLALTRPDDAALRRRAMTDGSPRVRRAAMRAAMLAGDVDDAGPLVESARLDPEPSVKTDAVRALAHLPPNAETANRLRDLFSTADTPLREDIVDAWLSPRIFAAGGREALRLLLASKSGVEALTAASALAHGRPCRDAELEVSSLALLARTIRGGTRRERLFAIAATSVSDAKDGARGSDASRSTEALIALRAAAEDDDVEIRTAALARLIEVPSDKTRAQERLFLLGGEPGPAAIRAQLALASAGDARTQAWIEAGLVLDGESERLLAANALVALHRAARAAPLLAAPEPQVRTRAACTLLRAVRSQGR